MEKIDYIKKVTDELNELIKPEEEDNILAFIHTKEDGLCLLKGSSEDICLTVGSTILSLGHDGGKTVFAGLFAALLVAAKFDDEYKNLMSDSIATFLISQGDKPETKKLN